MKVQLSFSVIARIIVSALLFWALAKHQYGYFVLLRWAVCGISAFCAYFSYSLKRIQWTWMFAILALLFNPVVPVGLDRQTWVYLDVATGLFILASIFFIRESLSTKDKTDV
ncbi:MAG: hypothetical protein C0417_10520 [Chlorobiaceae bacterium]|nr:hypothetical protein [Chlorobiaceae bacterium]